MLVPTSMILATLMCKPTYMLNVSGHPWNANDEKMLAYAKKRCMQIWAETPCVTVFRKYGKQDYTAICGAAKK